MQGIQSSLLSMFYISTSLVRRNLFSFSEVYALKYTPSYFLKSLFTSTKLNVHAFDRTTRRSDNVSFRKLRRYIDEWISVLHGVSCQDTVWCNGTTGRVRLFYIFGNNVILLLFSFGCFSHSSMVSGKR
jgi:hypothetical protein